MPSFPLAHGPVSTDSTILVLGVTDPPLQEQLREAIGVLGAHARFAPPTARAEAQAIVLSVDTAYEQRIRECRAMYDCALLALTDDASFDHASALLDAGADDVLLTSQLQRLPVSLAVAMKAVAERNKHARSHALQKAVNDHSPSEIFVKDLEGRYIYVNSTTARRYADTAGDILGKRAEDVFPEKQAADIAAHDREIIDSGRVVTHTIAIFDKYLQVTKFPIYDQDEQLVALGAIAADVTEQQGAMQALRASEARLQDYAELAADIFYETGPDWLLTRCDGRFQEITGLDSGSVVATVRPRITQQDCARHPEKWRALNERLKRLEAVTGFELEWTREDGKQISLLNNIKPMFDEAGEFVGYRGVAVDVTALRDTQRALREEEEHFRFLVENSSDFVTVLDSHGLIRYQSPSLAIETGYTIGERIGKSPLLFVHADDREYVSSAIKALLEEAGRTQTLIYRFESKEGDWRHIESRCRTVAGESGELEIIVNSSDVSKRIAAETALRETEAALRANEELLQGIMDHSPHEVFIKDLDKRYVFMNRRCEELTGITNEHARGKRSLDVFPGDVAQRMEQHDQQVIDTQRTVIQQEDVPYVDGVHTIIIAKFPIRDAAGETVRIGAVATDITEGSAAARALRVSEEHFRNVVEGSLQGILIHNIRDILFVNQAFQEIFGYPSIDEVREAYAERRLIAPQDWERVAGYAQASLTGSESPQRFEFDAVKADGSIMHIEASERRINWQGEPALQATVIDITERKLAEQALRQSQVQLRALTTLAPAGIFRTNTDGQITYVNEHWSELTGITTPQPSGDDWTYYMHEEDRQRVLKHWRDRLATRTVFRDEYRYQRPHRSLVWVYCVANPQYNEQGEFIGYVGALTNITARKQAQAELENYRDHLEELVDARTAELRAAVREQESFSYSVSHDLRSPLRTIDGFSHMLLDDYGDLLDAEGRKCLRRVRDASQRMGHLIDALLNLSRMSRRKMRVETVDLSDIANDILRRLQRMDPQRNTRLEVAKDLRAQGDSALLRVVLENLLSNAWKYSHKQPRTDIEVGRMDGPGSGFLVRDNGVGFDMRYADKLFKPFQRLHTFEEFEGTGIGLATVVRIIERHGGKVWAESEEGKGATFYFTV